MPPKKSEFTQVGSKPDEASARFQTPNGRSGTLHLAVKTEKFLDFTGLHRLNVDIRVLLDAAKTTEKDGEPARKKAKSAQPEEEHIGHIFAWHIRKEQQGAGGEGLAWMQELLSGRPLRNEGGMLGEARMILAALYTKAGEPRAVHKGFEELLDMPVVILIDGFVLDEDWRGQRLAGDVLALFHNIIRSQFIETKKGQQDGAMMVLSPALDSDTPRDRQPNSDLDMERTPGRDTKSGCKETKKWKAA